MTIKPIKSLGQNFLKDEDIIRRIISSLEYEPGDKVLEIGPGTGALTEHLAKLDIDLFAVEKDTRAFDFLKKKYPDIIFFNEDILQFDFRNYSKLKIIGNLPYYITSRILFNLFSEYQSVDKAIFTIQREVAKRIVSPPDSKDYGILSVASQLYSNTELLFEIPPTAFYPQPKVTSAVILMDFYNKPKYQEPEKLMSFVKVCFAQRRKKLSNTIKNYLNSRKLNIDIIEKSDYSYLLDKRAENLSLKDFINIYEFINFKIV